MSATSFPESLVIVNGAMAMDGGSISLRAATAAGDVHLFLDWSITSRARGRPQFSVNRTEVERGSYAETEWLRLIEQASFRAEVASGSGVRISEKRLVLGDDIAQFFAAVERGPNEALQELASRMVSIVRSPEYQTPPPRLFQAQVRDRTDEIRALLAEGKRLEAARVYRDCHPDVSLSVALTRINDIEKKT